MKTDDSKWGVSVESWAEFEMEMKHAQSQSSRLDPEEVRDHILKQIPVKLREKVMSAELKRQGDYFWVRISIPQGETAESVVREFEIIRRKRFSDTEKERGYVLINARTSQEKEALLEMDGDRLGSSFFAS